MGKKRKLAFLDLLVEASKGGTILSDCDIREEVIILMMSMMSMMMIMMMVMMVIMMMVVSDFDTAL